MTADEQITTERSVGVLGFRAYPNQRPTSEEVGTCVPGSNGTGPAESYFDSVSLDMTPL